MKVLEKIFFVIIFGAVLPITFFLAGWWGTVGLVEENKIFIFAISGLAIGIVLDFFLLKKIISDLYEISNSTLVLVYIFYSICCFGFFMGVPIFNSMLGIPAGYYAAKKCIYLKKETDYAEKYFKQTAFFTSVIITLISIASATIALMDPYTAKGLKDMLNLSFDLTKFRLVTVIILGGSILITFQYFLTRYTTKIIYRIFTKQV